MSFRDDGTGIALRMTDETDEDEGDEIGHRGGELDLREVAGGLPPMMETRGRLEITEPAHEIEHSPVDSKLAR